MLFTHDGGVMNSVETYGASIKTGPFKETRFFVTRTFTVTVPFTPDSVAHNSINKWTFERRNHF